MVGDVSVLDPGLVVCVAHDDTGDLAHALGQCIAHGRAPQQLVEICPFGQGARPLEMPQPSAEKHSTVPTESLY
jgi:hypothetical protein